MNSSMKPKLGHHLFLPALAFAALDLLRLFLIRGLTRLLLRSPLKTLFTASVLALTTWQTPIAMRQQMLLHRRAHI